MRDLARIGQELGRGINSRVLKPRSMIRMFKPAWTLRDGNGLGEDGTASGFFCAYGLAAHQIGNSIANCHDDPFGDGKLRLGHSGDAYGLRSGMWFDPWTGAGVAYFTSAVPDDAAKGKSAFTAIEEEVLSRAQQVKQGVGTQPRR